MKFYFETCHRKMLLKKKHILTIYDLIDRKKLTLFLMMLEQFFQRGPTFHDATSIFDSHNFCVALL